MKKKNIIILLLLPTCILLIPLVSMFFTSEVNWELNDFLTGGFLLYGTMFSVILIFSKVKSKKYRILFIGLMLFLLILVWAELAIGIFGTPFSGN